MRVSIVASRIDHRPSARARPPSDEHLRRCARSFRGSRRASASSSTRRERRAPRRPRGSGRRGVGSAAPFGVAERRRRVTVSSPTVVYPRLVALDELSLPRVGAHAGARDAREPRRGTGHEYLGIREYRVGDSMRHVHWPSTARHGALMVREFEREQTRRLAVVIDSVPISPRRRGRPRSTCAARSAASVAFARAAPARASGSYGDRRPRPVSVSRTDPAAPLRWLAELRPGGGMSMADLLDGSARWSSRPRRSCSRADVAGERPRGPSGPRSRTWRRRVPAGGGGAGRGPTRSRARAGAAPGPATRQRARGRAPRGGRRVYRVAAAPTSPGSCSRGRRGATRHEGLHRRARATGPGGARGLAAIRVVVAVMVEIAVLAVVAQGRRRRPARGRRPRPGARRVRVLVRAPPAAVDPGTKVVLAVGLLVALGAFLRGVEGAQSFDEARRPLRPCSCGCRSCTPSTSRAGATSAFSVISSLILIAEAGALSFGDRLPPVPRPVARARRRVPARHARGPAAARRPLSWSAAPGGAARRRRPAPRPDARAPGRPVAAAPSGRVPRAPRDARSQRRPAAVPRRPRDAALTFDGGSYPGLRRWGPTASPSSRRPRLPRVQRDVDLRSRGRLSDDVVMRVRSSQAALWRGLARHLRRHAVDDADERSPPSRRSTAGSEPRSRRRPSRSRARCSPPSTSSDLPNVVFAAAAATRSTSRRRARRRPRTARSARRSCSRTASSTR